MANGLNHWEISRRFIIQADAELAAGDLLQTSEKGWGAAAHAIKAVAQEREWRHDSHSRLFGVADRLASITGIHEIPDLFQTASETHKIFTKAICLKKTSRTVWRESERFWTFWTIFHPT